MSLPQPSISRPRERCNHLQVSWPQSKPPPSLGGLACRHHLTGRELCPPPPSEARTAAAVARSLPAGLLFGRNTTKSKAPKTAKLCLLPVFTGPSRTPKNPPSWLPLLPTVQPAGWGRGWARSFLQVHCVCFAGPAPRTARDCLSVAPHQLLPCAGDAADSGLISLFLSLPPFIYQA